MSGLTEATEGGNYLSVTAGRLRKKVSEGTLKAVFREYELKDGTKGSKWELVYKDLTGYITGIAYQDGDYGEQLMVSVQSGDTLYKVTMPSDSRYAFNFLRRAPGINFAEECTLYPYDVEDKGKKNTGIKVTQGERVVADFFYDPAAKQPINGIPEMKQELPDADDWKVYFVQVKKFLKRVVVERIRPKIEKAVSDRLTPFGATKKTEISSGNFSASVPEIDTDLPF